MSTISRLVRPMRPRDPAEPHRAATPLELLTDLCFVVAIAQCALTLHHAISEDHLADAAPHFVVAFFAIWWAWLNFAWFSSAYDNDDVPYRVLTLAQILGSLVLAAGIPRMFEDDFTLGVVGYVVMRLALVVQWWRASRQDPERRTTCRRYAIGIVVVQVGWILFLATPPQLGLEFVALLVLCEFVVPVWAERTGRTPWHPHHIAERYGLFLIIVLGETILSTTVAIQEALDDEGHRVELLGVVVGGVLVVFSLWWLYFAREAGDVLARLETNAGAYAWGFGHYFVYASGAAVGAGLAARVDFWTDHSEAPAWQSAIAVTLPVAVFLAAWWAVCIRHHDASARTWAPVLLAVAVVLAGTLTPVPELVAGLVCLALLVLELRFGGLLGDAEPVHA
ncbi:low temperature requirement protein A [Solicola sp. PLA-1-18]|uniref:low temperature requirement protein A n=1 Tax=Solicola sp. PLA-1-18 TaxID=3380532 RepID=UPI003B818245